MVPRNDAQGPKGAQDTDAFQEAAAAGHGQIHDAHDDLGDCVGWINHGHIYRKHTRKKGLDDVVFFSMDV